MDGICTLANDRMFPFLEAFLPSVRAHMPSLPIRIIPFDNNMAKTRALAKLHRAQVIEPDHRWDELGVNLFGDEDYRPGVPAWRYLRKLNAFNTDLQRFLFLDVNCLVLTDLRPLWPACMNDCRDIVFAIRSRLDRTISRADVRSVLDTLSPRLGGAFNACCFMSRRGTLTPEVALVIGRNKNLRLVFGRAPEQAFIAWYIAVAGLNAFSMVEISRNLRRIIGGARFSIERTADGHYQFAEGPWKNNPIYLLKWAGQDVSAVDGGKHAELFHHHRQMVRCQDGLAQRSKSLAATITGLLGLLMVKFRRYFNFRLKKQSDRP